MNFFSNIEQTQLTRRTARPALPFPRLLPRPAYDPVARAAVLEILG
ncbi:hypothetical protein [Sphingomonas sp. M1-B02]|nr:hypothetical protein [Sphingomonas sp. S6-11]UZK65959.1 hypothetical protein OKW87_15845 [Sphingomonas sp. S6-11]